MAKVIKTICVEQELWIKVQRKTESISATIGHLLEEWVKTADDIEKTEIQKLRLDMEAKNVQLAALKQQVDEFETKEKARKSKVIKVIAGGYNAVAHRR